jgi:Na+/proline symporter
MYAIIVLAAYTALMIAVTLTLSRRSSTINEFHVSNRNLGTVQSAMSIAATWIWAPALFTSAEKAYTSGTPGLFWFLVPNVICLLLFIPFAKRMRKQMPEGITLSGYMKSRYESKAVHGVYVFELSMLAILSTGVQLLAGAKILSVATGWPFWLWTIILAAIAYSYSQYSGIKASVLTDALQMVFMLGCCALMVPWALSGGGVSDLVSGLAGASGDFKYLFDANGLKVLFSFGLPTAIGLLAAPFGDQCFWQRAFSIRENRIGRAFGLGAFLFAMVPLSMGVLGFIAAGSGYVAWDSGMVNFELVGSLFPRWVMIPFMLMVLSGLLSTADSNLCAVASLTSDFGGDLKTAKKAMVLLLVLGVGIANIPGLTVTSLFLIYGALRSTTMLPTVFTLLGKKLNPKGVFGGVLTSMCIGMPLFIAGTLTGDATLKTIGCLCAVLLSGIVSLALAPRKEVQAA